jgi:hypothetical protein
MKKIIFFVHFLVFTLILSGCMYPEDRLAKNQVPTEYQVETVQQAIDNYQQKTGILPIKTRDMSTPIYEKYPIDFNKLVPAYLSEPPGNSYESGGVYLYVLVDVEENPTVKLLDLITIEKVRDLQLQVDMYRQENDYPPVEKVLANGRFLLNYEMLGLKEDPSVKSPFTGNLLPLIIDNNATVFVDYSMDLYQYMKDGKYDLREGKDIRNILVEDSHFVPVKSLPYTVQEDEPIFLIEE